MKDAHTMQENHGSCTEGEGQSPRKTQMSDALQHAGFPRYFLYILLPESQRAEAAQGSLMQ